MLNELNVECHQAVHEADGLIARYYLQHENVYGVLSNDSDFLIYNLRFIPLKKFSMEKGGDFKMTVYDNEISAKCLGIKPSQLPVFSCLVGNDYTLADLQASCYYYKTLLQRGGIAGKLGPQTIIKNAASFCRKYLLQENEDELEVIKANFLHGGITNGAKIIKSFKYSIKTLKGKAAEQKCPAELPKGFVDRYEACGIDNSLMNVAKYAEIWLRVLQVGDMEEMYYITRPIRQSLYGLLGQDQVTEYFQYGARFVQEKVDVGVCEEGLDQFWDGSLSEEEKHEKCVRMILADHLEKVQSVNGNGAVMLGRMALAYLIFENGRSEQAFLYEWEPCILMCHVVCLEKKIDVFEVAKKARSSEDESKISHKLKRLMAKIPTTRSISLSSCYQTVLWHMLLSLQTCNCLSSSESEIYNSFDSRQFSSLYELCYRSVVLRRNTTGGPWRARISVAEALSEFVAHELFADHENALFMYTSMAEGWKELGQQAYKDHFPDDYQVQAQQQQKQKKDKVRIEQGMDNSLQKLIESNPYYALLLVDKKTV